MSDLTPVMFTTAEAIRGCIGMSNADIPTDRLLSQHLSIALSIDLESWYSGDYMQDWVDSGFDPVYGAFDQSMENTSVDKHKGYLLSLYSMWFGAYHCIMAPTSITQMYSDGENKSQRFGGYKHSELISVVKSNLKKYRNLLIEANNGDTSYTILGPSSVGSSHPDPVTGQ